MNRRQLLTSGLIGTAALLGACSVGKVETSEGGGETVTAIRGSTTIPKAQGAPVTIALVSSGLDGPRLTVQIQQVIQDLHARGKAVELTHTLISPRAQGGPTALAETIDAAVNDGRQIDLLFVTNPEQLEGLHNLGRLLPVDEISRSDSGFSVGDYFPAAMQTVTFDGRAMGLPLWFRPITMSVNREAFADAGVEIPAGDWDWQTFLETAQRLTKRDGESVEQYGFVISPFDTPAYSFMWQNGAEIVAENSNKALITHPSAIEAVQFMRDLVHKYGVAPALAADGDLESLTPRFSRGGPFVGGTPVAMAPSAFGKSMGAQVNTTRSERDGRVEVTVDVIVTADEDGNLISGSGGGDVATTNLPRQQVRSNLARPGGALVVLSTSKSPEDAWAALRELGSALEPLGTVPARRLDAEGLFAVDPTLELTEAEAVIAAANSARVPVTPRKYEVLTVLQDLVDIPMLRGEAEPEDALIRAAREIEALLAG